MSEDKRSISEQADEIRRELDNLIGDEESIDVESDPRDLPATQRNTQLMAPANYGDMKASATKKAKKTITSLMKFYLDADIISVNDPTSDLLETFSQIKSDGNVVAAKIELTRDQDNQIFNTLNLKSDVKFNAGVLVIDFNAWIEREVESDLLKILNLRFNEIFDYDQEVLNIYFDGEFTKLDKNLNYQAVGGHDRNMYSFIKKNVNFLHYLGKGKPWNVDNYTYITSNFYQNEFKKLGFQKPHLIFPRNMGMLKRFLKLLFSSDFKNYESRFKFLKYSFISFFKK